MNRQCLHGFVSGRVQGVSFRAFVRAQALAAGVTGWAKNRADGRVEVLLCGDCVAVQQVADALREGPPLARVDDVALTTADEPTPPGFRVL